MQVFVKSLTSHLNLRAHTSERCKKKTTFTSKTMEETPRIQITEWNQMATYICVYKNNLSANYSYKCHMKPHPWRWGCTVGKNNRKPRCKYWATRSSVRSFAHTSHSFARSLTSPTPSLVGQWMIGRLFILFLDAPSHLYKRVCPSVGPSVCPALFSDAY